MTKDRKYSNSKREDFLRYLEGNLSDRERNRIERELMRDPFEQEAMEGYAELSPEEAGEDLRMLDDQVRLRTAVKKSRTWYRVAAVAAVLLAVSITFVTVFDDRISLLNNRVAESDEPAEEKKMESPVLSDEMVPPEEIQLEQEPPVADKVTSEEIEYVPEESMADMEEMEESDMMMVPEDADKDLAAGAASEDLTTAPQHLDITESIESGLSESLLGSGTRLISCTVVSGEDSQPLPGVSLMMKETSVRAVSDMGGNFEIPVSDDNNNTLIADFIGMQSQEISITDQ